MRLKECSQTVRAEPKFGIRHMVPSDVGAVRVIESNCFESPFSLDEIQLQRTRRLAESIVAVAGQAIVGYATAVLHGDLIHLTRLAVLPQHRRQGIGSALLGRFEAKLGGGRDLLNLHCPETALTGHLFLHSRGYRATAIHQDFFESGEAAYYFERLADAFYCS